MNGGVEEHEHEFAPFGVTQEICRCGVTRTRVAPAVLGVRPISVTSADIQELRMKTMGKNVRALPTGEGLEITNERMLAVRDDLMQFVNNQFRNLAVGFQNEMNRMIGGFQKVFEEQEKRAERTAKLMEDLREEVAGKRRPRCATCRRQIARKKK